MLRISVRAHHDRLLPKGREGVKCFGWVNVFESEKNMPRNLSGILQVGTGYKSNKWIHQSQFPPKISEFTNFSKIKKCVTSLTNSQSHPFPLLVKYNTRIKVRRGKNVSFSRCDLCLKVCFDTLRFLMVQRHILAGVGGCWKPFEQRGYLITPGGFSLQCNDMSVHSF